MALNDSRTDSPKYRRFTDAKSRCESMVGPDVTIRGEIEGRTDMEFCGSLEGNISIEGFLWLRAGSRVDGNLSSNDLLIEGEARGNITVRGKAELRSSCRVEGDIVAQGVAIADGGFFEGSITMAGQSSSRTEVEFKEKRSVEDQ